MRLGADNFLYGPLERDTKDTKEQKEETEEKVLETYREAGESETPEPLNKQDLKTLRLALENNRQLLESNDSLPGKMTLGLIITARAPFFLLWTGLSALSTLVASIWNGDLLLPGLLWLGAFCLLFLGKRALEKHLQALDNQIESNRLKLQEEVRKIEERLEEVDPLKTTAHGILF